MSRTPSSIKAFQPWKYGSSSSITDIRPGRSPRAGLSSVTDNEGGFFGGTTVAISRQRIAGRCSPGATYDWGPLTDIYVKYEAEHVSKFGMLHYCGLAC